MSSSLTKGRLSSAAALLVAQQVASLREGAAVARELMTSGAAERVLDRYIASSRAVEEVAR